LSLCCAPGASGSTRRTSRARWRWWTSPPSYPASTRFSFRR
jgi:hypothetical protein